MRTLNIKRLERLQNILAEMVEAQFVSGSSCMVLQQGREVCYYENGYRDLEERKPLTRETIFRLYSLTKPMTAVAVMMLLEEGRLDLLFSQVFKTSIMSVTERRSRCRLRCRSGIF